MARASSTVSGTRAPRKPRKLLGRTEPRLFTPPLRRLTRHTTRGYEVIDFARDVVGEPLLPWQAWAAKHGLELNPDGTLRFRVVVILVARQNGKSHLKRTVTLWRMYVDGAKLVLGVGQDVSLAREQWQACIDTIQSVPELAAELETVRRTNGDEWFKLTNGSRYKISAANRSAGRGLPVEQLDFEEAREQRDWLAWGALSKTTMAQASGQIWVVSNAGDDQSVVLNHLREAALSGRDPSICLMEWSAPEGCELDDPKAIAQANPALGTLINVQSIRSARATDPPNIYRTEVFCQRVDALDSAVNLDGWKAGEDPGGTMNAVRKRVVACVDVSPDGDHVALLTAADLPGDRVRVEVVEAWPDTDIASELRAELRRVKPRAIAWFPSGPAAALGPVIRGVAAELGIPVVDIRGEKVPEACMSFADAVAARRVLHPDDPLLNAHLAGASKMPQGDGWRFARRGGAPVNAAYAAAGAVHTALTLPIEQPLPRPMIV